MREVTAAIIRRNGKILICRRAEGSCAHLWEFPGGKTEPGETPFECLTRELREELNIEINPLREYCRSVCGELSFVFIEAEIISGEPELSVHEKMRWVSPGELTAFEWCPADRPVAEEISKSKENILADLIKEELVTEFRLRCKKVHPAVETMIDKASKAAHNEGEYYGYNDVFISEEEK